MRLHRSSLVNCYLGVVAAACLLLALIPTVSSSVIGIDYGTDWFKVTIVKTGMPNEIVLNAESKRKTSSAVLLRGNVRHYGSDASSLGTRFPEDNYPSLKNLLGRLYEDPLVEEYRGAFQNTMIKDEKRGTVAFKQGQNDTYTVEELVAFQLAHAKDQAEKHGGGESVSGAVISVPPYWNHFERRALLDAAELAGLRVLTLLNDETAVALSFAMSRQFPAPEYHIFYDMGAGSTVASLVKFEQKVIKEGKFKKKTKITELEVKAVGHDASLGGQSIDRKIQQLLAKRFKEEKGKKLGVDIFGEAKAMAKLLREANRVKHILSANQETFAGVEGLLPDVDFRTKVTRAQLEEACPEVFERVPGPVKTVLEEAGLTLADIKTLVLVGGGVRVPAIKAKLEDTVGADKIAQNVNGDEAAVVGAGWHAAKLSALFRLAKDVRIKDINENPVEFSYLSEQKAGAEQRTLRTVLFSNTTVLGAKKLVTFKRTSDFEFDLSYKEDGTSIAKVAVEGIDKALGKHANGTDPKVKVSVELNENGLVDVGEGCVQVQIDGEKEANPSIKDKVLNFFGGKKDKETKASEKEEATGESESEAPTDANNATVTAGLNDTNTTTVANITATPKKVIEKVNLDVKVTWQTVTPFSEEGKKEAKKRISQLDAEDTKRRLREEAANHLESFIYRAKEFLYDDEVERVSLEEERIKLKDMLEEAGDWIYEEGSKAVTLTEHFTDKLKEIKKLYDPIHKRRKEYSERPGAIEGLKTTIKEVTQVLTDARANNTKDAAEGEELIHSDSDLLAIEKAINETTTWLSDKESEQEEREHHKDPAVLVEQIVEKANSVRAHATLVAYRWEWKSADRLRRKILEAKKKREAEEKKKKEEEKEKKRKEKEEKEKEKEGNEGAEGEGKGEGEEGKKEEGKEDKTEEKETVAAKEAEPETGTASRKPVETEGGHDEL